MGQEAGAGMHSRAGDQLLQHSLSEVVLGMAGHPSAGGNCQQRSVCSPPPYSWGWRLSKMLIEAGCLGTAGCLTLL